MPRCGFHESPRDLPGEQYRAPLRGMPLTDPIITTRSPATVEELMGMSVRRAVRNQASLREMLGVL